MARSGHPPIDDVLPWRAPPNPVRQTAWR